MPDQARFSGWNWDTLPSRHDIGGDLYPVLLLLRPRLLRLTWSIEPNLDALGEGMGEADAIAAGNPVDLDQLVAVFERIYQVIDGTIVGVHSDGSRVEIGVVDNTYLDVVSQDPELHKYCASLFGPPVCSE